MFMKVFQYPPRRGNGSYWTLLSDGEEELQKAIPLFATLQPPVIDSNSTYHKQPCTHTVKSKGKFIPVLPRGNMANGSLPYFSVGSNLSSSSMRMDSVGAADEVVIGGSSQDGCGYGREGRGYRVLHPRNHLCDHDYAKSWHYKEAGGVDTVVELAAGRGRERKGSHWDDSIQSDESFADPPTPKKRQKLQDAVKSKPFPVTRVSSGRAGEGTSPSSPSFTTPPKEQDSSLHLLDSSFLTPLKNMAVPDVEIGAISFSPLYTNLITPGNAGIVAPETSHPFFPSPLTPLRSSLDSGIFSPLRSDCLGGMKFSTPTNMSSLSPLADLSSFSSLQPEFYSFKGSQEGSGSATPHRPGSLQALGLPGLTPPSRK